MPEKRGKILVIRGGAIGDFILTLPALAALRATFPQTHLELLGYPKVAELARAANVIDAFRSIEARPLARFFARNAQLDDEWSGYFESFNLIISYLYDPDEIFRTNVGRTSKAQFIQAQHRPDENEVTHATRVFLRPLEQLAIFDADPVPSLNLAAASAANGRWVALHPGSGSERKNWPKERWAELLRKLATETSANVLLVGGEAEGDRVQALARTLPPERRRVLWNLPLPELARELSESRLFVGHDSGITHLAAALGIPTLVLWGPSRQEIWQPLHPATRILSSNGKSPELPVDLVWQELRSLIG